MADKALLGAALVALAITCFDTTPVHAQAAKEPPGARSAPRATGLPLPRFASLRAREVYMRAGPGTRYPVEWIYKRRGLPVEIVAEFDTWRKVRDWTGTIGWVHRAMLSGKRTGITLSADTVLRRSPAEGAAAVARAEPGVVAEIENCEGAWCRITARGLTGWAARSQLWGVYPREKLD
jgi:SH3-like domain-containing protein